MKTLKLFLASLLAGVSLMVAPAALAAGESGLITGPVCKISPGLAGCKGASNAQCDRYKDSNGGETQEYKNCIASAAKLESKNGYLTLLLDSFIFAAAIVATIFLLIGGIRYITSTGDPARISSAKNTIQYAIIGLIVAILARFLIGYVIDVFT